MFPATHLGAQITINAGTQFSPTTNHLDTTSELKNIFWHCEEGVSILSSVTRTKPSLMTQLATSPDHQENGEALEGPSPHVYLLENLLPLVPPLLAIEDSHSLGLIHWLVNAGFPLAFGYYSSKWPFSMSISLLWSFCFFATFSRINNHGNRSGDFLACSFVPQPSIPQFSFRAHKLIISLSLNLETESLPTGKLVLLSLGLHLPPPLRSVCRPSSNECCPSPT